MYKARIKILVKALSAGEIRRRRSKKSGQHLEGRPVARSPQAEVDRVAAYFAPPAYEKLPGHRRVVSNRICSTSKPFARWVERNVHAAQGAGLRVGDAVAQAAAAWRRATPPTSRWTPSPIWPTAISFGELRVSHEQNLILADVHEARPVRPVASARRRGFATPNIGLLTDIIACPGGDFCSLANAQVDPDRRRPSRSASTTSTTCTTSATSTCNISRLHQLVRSPPHRPHRHPRRRQGRRGVVPGHARRRATARAQRRRAAGKVIGPSFSARRNARRDRAP